MSIFNFNWRPKKKKPEHVEAALSNAEYLMGYYSPLELNEYLQILRSKIRRLRNQRIEDQEHVLTNLKNLQP